MGKNSITIISDGNMMHTTVLNHEDKPIKGMTAITIHPLYAEDKLVTATIEFTNVSLEIKAAWEHHPLRQWADRKVGKSVE